MRHLIAMRMSLLLGVAGSLSSCTSTESTVPLVTDDVSLLGLVDTLATALGSPDSILLVLAPPSECFACSDIMQAIVSESRRSAPRVFLVLTANPSSEQQKQLMLQRVHIARVVSAPKATETGSEVALVAGDSVRVRLPLRQLGASEVLLRFLGLSAIPVPGGEQL